MCPGCAQRPVKSWRQVCCCCCCCCRCCCCCCFYCFCCCCFFVVAVVVVVIFIVFVVVVVVVIVVVVVVVVFIVFVAVVVVVVGKGSANTTSHGQTSKIEQAVVVCCCPLCLSLLFPSYFGNNAVNCYFPCCFHLVYCWSAEPWEVQRVAVPNYTQQVTLRVTGPAQGSDCWRFARNSDCQAEERTVELFGTELVAPPSPSFV
ncbi:unnamed protein product [Polarella glacialis]|uniref:Uncharacterized protein n=1 Tax=Polarella glacialis TaxID=89957 RepID=A0A813HDI6_POLGL|nr:unnamed protein product [Polarella glacialis]